jgi:hypothetical protein
VKTPFPLFILTVISLLLGFKTETSHKFNTKKAVVYNFDSVSKNNLIFDKSFSEKGKVNFQTLNDSTRQDQIKNNIRIENYARFGAIMGFFNLLLATAVVIFLKSPTNILLFVLLGLIFTIPLAMTSGLLTLRNNKRNGKSIFAIISSLLAFGVGLGFLILSFKSCGE